MRVVTGDDDDDEDDDADEEDDAFLYDLVIIKKQKVKINFKAYDKVTNLIWFDIADRHNKKLFKLRCIFIHWNPLKKDIFNPIYEILGLR